MTIGLTAETQTLGTNSPSAPETLSYVPQAAGLVTRSHFEADSIPDVSHSSLPSSIGRFLIRRFLGEGAFGAVYEAYDPQLDRAVAIKVAKLGRGDSEQRVKRFLREAKSAAGLRHPHIVPVHEFGRAGEMFYIVSAFIKGRTLQESLAEQKAKPPDLVRAARIVRQLAEALAYAHREGIVHRDVKPGNVMLDVKDEPMLMDFGLATRQAEAEKLTHAGAIIGTPLYMAPEQAKGEQATPASDQYSLGVILFEMITGTPPFAGTPEIVMYKHMEEEPRRPSALNSAIGRDLETICLMCLGKAPERRYADVDELAKDLSRQEEGNPISARRSRPMERLAKWSRKNPMTASLLGVLGSVLLIGCVVSWGLTTWALGEKSRADRQTSVAKKLAEDEGQAKAKAEKERAEAEVARRDADSQRRKAVRAKEDADEQRKIADDRKSATERALSKLEGQLYASNIALAQNACNENNVAVMNHYLAMCPPDLRGWEYDLLQKLGNRRIAFKGHTKSVWCLSLSRDRKRIASGSADGTIKVWDAATGKELVTLLGHSAEITSVSFSHDAKRIASGSRDNTIRIWNAATGDEIASLKGHSTAIRNVVFGSDGTRIVSSSSAQAIKLWDVMSGNELATFEGHSKSAGCVSISEDGKWVASGAGDGTLRVWDAATGKSKLTIHAETYFVTSVSFNGDATRVATAGADRIVKIWDVESGKQVLALKGHPDGINTVAYSDNGRRIVSQGMEYVKVWDATSGEELRSLRVHHEGNRTFPEPTLGGDGKLIVTRLDSSGLFEVWDTSARQETFVLNAQVQSVSFSADDQSIVGANSGRVYFWNAATGQELPIFTKPLQLVQSVALFNDGNRIVTGSLGPFQKGGGDIQKPPGKAMVWDMATEKEITTFNGHSSGILCVSCSNDGKRIATGSYDNTLKVWEADSGQEIFTLRGHAARVSSVVFSHDDKWIASASFDNTIKLWDATSGAEVRTLKGHSSAVTCLAFSRDNAKIASGSYDKTVKLWEATTGQELFTLSGHANIVACVSFSSDCKRVASGSTDNTIKLWNTASGQETLTIRGHSAAVEGLAFSRQGRRLVSCSRDGTIRVWE